jgi:excisionase family DNA binding protein
MPTATMIPTATVRPPGAPWSMSEAATYLQVSVRHLQRMADAGHAKSIRIGKRVLIPDTEVRRLAENGTR